ncbi:putative F-box protein [Drosera capensis]
MKTPKHSYRHHQHHHQANFLQLKLSDDDELADRISELPDEVLWRTPCYSYHLPPCTSYQLKLSNDDELADRISELPDEVLCCILSHLSLQEAARTTILSCRWRYVWKRMMSWTLTLQKLAVE